jgi:uncharacterized membrane protein YfcA
MDAFTPDVIALLSLVALVAGFVDAIAGGGGLLTVPALLAAGLPPAQALATNKLQGSFGSLAAALHFLREGYVSLREMRLAILCTFIGAGLGAVAVQVLAHGVLAKVVPVLLILATLYFVFSPRVSDVHGERRIGDAAFALLIGTGVGFYDGFFGPGTGSFFVLGYIGLLGLSARVATARTKVLNFTSNFAALLFFIAGGKVVWAVGLPMAVGQFIGGRLGAGVVIGAGARVVKPMLVAVSLLLTVKVVWENSGGFL